MGLTELTSEEFLKLQELVKLLSVFGITEDDLRYLPQALKIVKEGNAPSKTIITEEEKKAIENKFKNITKPEDFVKSFESEIEEFYPNGRDDKDN